MNSDQQFSTLFKKLKDMNPLMPDWMIEAYITKEIPMTESLHEKIKPIMWNWILITYDIPRHEVALRRRVIRQLLKLGAVMHTQSVYYLPYSKEAISIASSIPDCYVWCSTIMFEEQASSLTEHYMLNIKVRIENYLNQLRKFHDSLSSPSKDLRAICHKLKAFSKKFDELLNVIRRIPDHVVNSSGITEMVSECKSILEDCREKYENLKQTSKSASCKRPKHVRAF